MQAKIANSEGAIKLNGEDKSIRITLDILDIEGDEIISLFYSLIGSTFEITINNDDDTSPKKFRYYG